MRAPAGTGRHGPQTDVALGVHAPEKGVTITGLVIPATPFPAKQQGKPFVPDAGGGGFVQPEGVGALHMLVKGLAQTQKNAATHLLVETGILVFRKKTAPPDEVSALPPGKRAYHAGHGPSTNVAPSAAAALREGAVS